MRTQRPEAMTLRTRWTLFVVMLACVFLAEFTVSFARAEEPRGEIQGMILSIRGNILVVRPSLRPKLTRVAFSDKTAIFAYERTSAALLKPGMRVALGGRYTEHDGFHANWIEAADTPRGELKRRAIGLKIDKAHQRAMGRGRLKSVQPFVFVDDAGKAHTAKLDQLQGIWRDFVTGRDGLMIGTQIQVAGTVASDGVIKAETITPDHNFTPSGTLFGVVVAVDGKVLAIRPKYTTETLRITCAPDCTLQRQITLDPDDIKVGQHVTFWGQQRNHAWDNPKSDDLLAYALLVGKQRYPAAQGSNGGVFLTGTLSSLDRVRLALPSGKVINIVIPGQMPVVHLESINFTDIRPGEQAMLVLKRLANGSFQLTALILDASPFVGYGG